MGAVAGLVAWGVALLLSPEDGPGRHLAAAVLCALGAVAVAHLRAPPEQPEPETDGRAVPPDPGRRERAGGETAGAGPPVEGPPLLREFARLETERVARQVAELASSAVECPGENHEWLLALTRAAGRSVRATSTSVDLGFWNSEPAGRYLEAQHEAITDRGVPVRRLFLVDGTARLDERLLRLCEEQELLRIDVRVVVLPELPAHLARGLTSDGVVFDEEVSYEIERDLREVNVRTRIDARPEHVRSRTRRFEELWEAGMGLRELEVRVDDEEDGTRITG
ncbi:hypothetical protein ACS0VI_11650 [Streptomyces sp. H28]|uniref:hypothetical protein n=1 Tax=Streptomyces sp. H28 TaxID=2775865 RepID=UPI00298BD045|nr:hypothetical protein [Streptomyces sp. H28]